MQEWFFAKSADHDMSARQVARYWNAQGIRAVTRYAPGAAKVRPFNGVPGHGRWTERRITAIIRNPVYWGEPEVLSGTHGAVSYQRPLPPIVSRELALRPQAALAANKRRPRHAHPKHVWLYSGKLICERCGMSFVGAPQKGYFYYHGDSWSASEHLSPAPKRVNQSCGAKMVQEAAVDRAVWPRVRAALEQRAAIFADAWDRILAARADRDGIAHRRAGLQARLRELGAKQERIRRMVKEGWEDNHTGKAEVAEIEQAKVDLAGELRGLRDADCLADDARAKLREWQRRLDGFAADLDLAGADPALERTIIEGVVGAVRMITSGSGRAKRAALKLTLALGPVPVARERAVRYNGPDDSNQGGDACASPTSRVCQLTAISS